MKKVFALLSAPLMLAALLTSCKPEQSELNLDALPGSATITGKVEYNPGDTKVGTAVVSDYKLPAEGRTVEVKVFTDAYTNPNEEIASDNYRTFRATTDEKGHYSVSVPVGYHGIYAEVTVLSFIGQKTVVNANDSLVILENAVFSAESKEAYLEDQSIVERNFTMSSNKTEDLVFDQKVTLTGLVEAAGLSRRDEEVSVVYNAFPGKLTVKVFLDGELTMTYPATANSNGRYNLEMLLPNTCWDHMVSVTVIKEPSLDDFTHYYYQNEKWNAQTVEVIYAGQRSITLDKNRHKLVPATVSTMELIPQPVNREDVKGIGNESDTDDDIDYYNPFEW